MPRAVCEGLAVGTDLGSILRSAPKWGRGCFALDESLHVFISLLLCQTLACSGSTSCHERRAWTIPWGFLTLPSQCDPSVYGVRQEFLPLGLMVSHTHVSPSSSGFTGVLVSPGGCILQA